ncbi:MAG: hypothetical protein V3V04_03320 [Rhizobiaceae bacterium]
MKFLTSLLLLPGNIVLKMIGITVEEDSGIVRSFINSVFWGAIVLGIAMQYFDI